MLPSAVDGHVSRQPAVSSVETRMRKLSSRRCELRKPILAVALAGFDGDRAAGSLSFTNDRVCGRAAFVRASQQRLTSLSW